MLAVRRRRHPAGWIGYVVDEEDCRRKFGEATDPFLARGAHCAAGVVRDEVTRMSWSDAALDAIEAAQGKGNVAAFSKLHSTSPEAGPWSRLTSSRKLLAIVERMVQESGNPHGFDARRWLEGWLAEPVGALGHRRPIDMLREPDGFERVKTASAHRSHVPG